MEASQLDLEGWRAVNCSKVLRCSLTPKALAAQRLGKSRSVFGSSRSAAVLLSCILGRDV